MLERGAVHVHVARGDHAEERRRPAEAEGRLELPGEARVAPRAHAHARAAGLAMRDDGDVAETVVEGGLVDLIFSGYMHHSHIQGH